MPWGRQQNSSNRRTGKGNGRILAILVAAFLWLGLLPFVMFTLYKSIGDSPVGRSGESIGSRLYRYNNRIYLNIAGQGFYLIPEADAVSFQSLSRGDVSPLAKDNKAVYCGSRIIEGLTPDDVRMVHPGYVASSHRAWFCSREQDNPDYRWWHVFTRDSSDDSPDKERRKDFFLTELTGVNPASLKTIAIGYAHDDQTIFYEGKPIPNSSGKSAGTVPDRSTDRSSNFYLRDQNRVYYKGEALIGASPTSFLAMDDGLWQTDYGLDTASGRFFAGASPFPDKVNGVDTRSLHRLPNETDRAYQELFYNDSGIWFWDYRGGGLTYACGNPFAPTSDGKPVTLAPGVWADGGNTLFARSREVWGQGKGNRSLISRNTDLLMLRGVKASDWRKLENLKYKIWTTGALWQAEGKYYFTPFKGNGHGFNDAMYLVKDLEALRQLSGQNKISAHLIGQVLAPLDKDNAIRVCSASSSFRSFWFW